jgi:hypothetical protein
MLGAYRVLELNAAASARKRWYAAGLLICERGVVEEEGEKSRVPRTCNTAHRQSSTTARALQTALVHLCVALRNSLVVVPVTRGVRDRVMQGSLASAFLATAAELQLLLVTHLSTSSAMAHGRAALSEKWRNAKDANR